MSEDDWAASTSTETVLVLAALAVYLGGVTGFAPNLPRIMMRSPAWQADTARRPVSGAVTLTVLIVLWPVSIVYLACRIAARRRRRRPLSARRSGAVIRGVRARRASGRVCRAVRWHAGVVPQLPALSVW